MENVWLFLATVTVYYFAWWIYEPKELKNEIARIALLMALCAPFNIGGNVFTVIGNAKSSQNVYSFTSLYQNAGQNAVTLFGLFGYQNAGRDAITLFGLSGYQNAGRSTGIFIGLSGYQNAGLAAITFIGLSGYQNAGYEAFAFGVALFQRVLGKERTFGVGSLKSDNK